MNPDPLLTTALHHWGARAVPFSDAAETTPWASPAWAAARRLFQQTAALRSVLLLTGDNGVGKSAFLAHSLAALEPKVYVPVVLTHATLSGSGILAVLLHRLGKKPSIFRSRNLTLLEETFRELGRLTPVLALDEAQLYPLGALEEIRLLLGLNLARQPLFALVLAGDLYLQDTLRLQQHKALYSRIAAQAQLLPLEPAQVEAYLRHGLQQVGVERPALTPAAVSLLASASAGLPRSLNLLARSAWLAAAQAGAPQIGPEHVQDALAAVPAVQDRLAH